jgi:hypothetical protein
VLKRALPVALALGALAGTLPASEARSAERQKAGRSEAARAIREPVRLTAGASSELMGVLGADERSLYFVSDAGGTLDIMRQSLQAQAKAGVVVAVFGLVMIAIASANVTPLVAPCAAAEDPCRTRARAFAQCADTVV